MQRLLVVTVWSAILPVALFAQTASPGMSTDASRRLGSVGEMGHQQKESATKAEPASAQWRSLSSEAADDPTLGGGAPAYDPPKAARKAVAKGEHLSKKGQHEEAITEFRAALDIDPQYYEAENNLALELQALGKTEEAEKTLRHLMESAPEHILAFTNLATLLCQQHRYAEAEAVARQGLERHRFSFKSNYLLGAALVDEGKWTDEAREKLKYAEAKYPEAKALLEKWPASAAHN